jgi:hypothetical protein
MPKEREEFKKSKEFEYFKEIATRHAWSGARRSIDLFRP